MTTIYKTQTGIAAPKRHIQNNKMLIWWPRPNVTNLIAESAHYLCPIEFID